MEAVFDRDCADEAEGQVEFFGFKLRVRNPHLAALLAGDEDVQVERRCPEPAAAAPETGDAGVARRAGRADSGGVVVQLRRPVPGS